MVECHQSNVSGNLTISNFPKVRKHIYIFGNCEPCENIGVLYELIGARDEFAKVMCSLHVMKLCDCYSNTRSLIYFVTRCAQRVAYPNLFGTKSLFSLLSACAKTCE
jgi:hypothetical protein